MKVSMPQKISSALQQKIRGKVLSGDLLLEEHRTNFGRIFQWDPQVVVFPESAEDVQETIRFALAEGLTVSTRGAAHSQSQVAISEGGILIDMKSMNRIRSVDIKNSSVWVDGGAIWREVVERTWQDRLVPPVLTNNLGVTVGGTLSSAGVGVASFRFGTQADHALELEVVTGEGDFVRCSRTENRDLFWGTLAGLGQCGVITGAKLELRRPGPMVRTYYLLYDDLDRFLEDSRQAIHSDRFDHMESWCSPCPQGLRTREQGRRPFARWFFPFHLSVEFDPKAPPGKETEILRDLRPYERIHCEDLPLPDFLRRLDPVFDLWKKGGTWEFTHPWMETVLPMDRAGEYIGKVLKDLPPQVMVGGHVLLWVSSGNVSKVPLFMRPEASHVVGFGILPAVPHRWLDRFRPFLEMTSALSMEYGGKRYLSGYVQFDRETWIRHYGPRWEEFVSRKKTFDPRGILNPGYIPLLEETGPGESNAVRDVANELPEFGSPDWARAVADGLNADTEYRSAGKGWGVGFNGHILLRVEPDGVFPRPIGILYRLKERVCDGVEILDGDPPPVGFVLSAPYQVWKNIFQGKTRALSALMTGKIQVAGSKTTLLKHTRTAQAVLRVTASIPTRFPG